MPGIMACRNLAAARSSSSKTKMKKPMAEDFVAVGQKFMAKGKSENFPQLHFRSKNNVVDQHLARRRLFGDDNQNAAEIVHHDQSSGSEHEPSSVSLAAMVDEFMEDQATLEKCTGICKPNRGDRSPDDCAMNLGGELVEIFKGFMACETDTEKKLWADVSRAIDASVKDQDGSNCANGSCLKRAAMKILRQAGYNAALCKSRWDRVGAFPGGDYEYIDLLLDDEEGSSSNNKKKQRLIVDVDFREQFVIARPTERYVAMLEEVPHIFVGKAERLQQVVNVLSDAVKESLKKRGMHIPPWRKADYYRAKWFSAYKRTTNDSHPHEPNEVIVSRALSHTAIRGSGLDDTRFTNEMEQQVGIIHNNIKETEFGFKQIPREQTLVERKSLEERQQLEEQRMMQQQEKFIRDAVRTVQDEIITAMSSDWQPPEINCRKKPVRLSSLLFGARQQQTVQELGQNRAITAVS